MDNPLASLRRWAFGVASREPRAEAIPSETYPATQETVLIDAGTGSRELVMLPHDAHSLDYATKWLVQLKADGIRSLYIDGRVVTREGGAMDCALHCQPALKRLEEAFGEPMFFDGEYVEDEGFSATMSAFRRGYGEGVLWLFDAVPLEQWRRGMSIEPTRLRLQRLKQHISAADSPFVGMLDAWELSAADAMAKARELWAEGYEGIVVKDPNAPYRRWRDDAWLRLKQTVTHDVPIVDIIEDRGALKSIVVRTPDGPARISRGISPANAKIIQQCWSPAMEEPLYAEISYQRSTGIKRSIRAAAFIRLRRDKGAVR